MIKMGNDTELPLKRLFQIFFDDICRRQKFEDNALFKGLSNYQQNTKFTIQLNLYKILDAKLSTNMVRMNSNFIGKVQNYIHYRLMKLQIYIKENQ